MLDYRGVSEECDTSPGAGTRCLWCSGAGPARGWQGEELRGQLVPAHREDGADGPLSSLKLLAVLQPFGSCFGGFSGAPSPADTVGPPPAAQLCGGTLFFLLAVLYHERVTAP